MDDTLASIITTAKMMHELDRKIQAYKDAEKLLQARRNELAFKDLPALYAKAGNLTEVMIELDDGRKINVVLKPRVHAKLSAADKEAVFDWMKDNDYEHHISNDVIVPFTKGQEEELKEFEKFLSTAPKEVNYAIDKSVHSSTYTAFCKRIVDEGYMIDDDTFGIFRQEEVELVPVKQKS